MIEARVQALLAEEAARLDAGDLEGWLALLTDDVRVEIPPPDQPDADPAEVLHLVADDRRRVAQRVAQLVAQPPAGRPRTRRIVGAARITEAPPGFAVRAPLLLRVIGPDTAALYSGELRYRVVEQQGELRIALRRIVLDDPVVGPLTGLV